MLPKRLISSLKTLSKEYNVDIFNTDFFEKCILKIAGVQEKPNGCRNGFFQKIGLEYWIFLLAISAPESIEKLLALNNSFPALNVTDITDTIPKEQNGYPPLTLSGHPVVVIRMNNEGICTHLLPLIENYLKTHDNERLDFQRESNNYTSPIILEKLARTFMDEGISLFYFVSILGLLVQRSFEIAPQVHLALTKIGLPATISNLVVSYLVSLNSADDLKASDLVPPVSAIVSQNPHFLRILLGLEESRKPAAKLLVNYFNANEPNSAILETKSVDIPEGFQVVRVANKNFHQSFFSDLKDRFQEMKPAEKESYQNGSKEIPPIKILAEISQKLTQENECAELKSALDELVKHVLFKRLYEIDEVYNLLLEAQSIIHSLDNKCRKCCSNFFRRRTDEASYMQEVRRAKEPLNQLIDQVLHSPRFNQSRSQ